LDPLTPKRGCWKYQAKAVASVHASVSGSSMSPPRSPPAEKPAAQQDADASGKPRRGEGGASVGISKAVLPQSPGLSRPQAHAAAQEKKFDLLSDLGGDIFAAPPSQTAGSTNFANFAQFPSQTAPQDQLNTNFANFEAFGNSAIPSHLSSSPPLSSGGGVPVPSMCSAVPAQSRTGTCSEDRYAALAELDNELSFPDRNVFGPVLGSSPAQNPPVLPSIPSGFGAVPSTNPFVATAMAPDMATNPFQPNGRAPPAAPFGTGSMSMPTGFGNASSYCLPTSFSGNFQQQFPGQAPLPYSQPGPYHPQSNGPAFPVYGQNKPSITPFGQPMAVPGMSNNPFMAGSFPAGGSSTNPFL
uniref:ArfGAP with FG repeats 1b n=1 Tax=Oryzias sinensis TaxID=183150 RepID=A0A8C7X303_9TELE